MLDASFSSLEHVVKNCFLIFLSLALLPLSTSILVLSYGLQPFVEQNALRRELQRSPHFRPKTVLVTGMGMAKGLSIARAFYATGHRVIGADYEPYAIPVNGRFSKAIAKFFRISKPSVQHGATNYLRDLVYIVEKEGVDLWVSCSDLDHPAKDGQVVEYLERRTKCKSIQFDTQTMTTLHEKDSFIKYTESLGLPVPETQQVVSREAVHNILNDNGTKKKYIMKMVEFDESARAGGMTVLPKRTSSQTYDHVSRLPISESTPWVMQQFIKGEEYCTHSVVVDGKVRLFVACPSSEQLMHYQALPQDSALNRAMFRYTQEFAWRTGRKFTGHLSFDFMVEETATEGGVQKNIYPIECNPRAHTAAALFSDVQGSVDMVNAYMTVFDSPALNGINAQNEEPLPSLDAGSEAESVATCQSTTPGYYWIGHDIVALVLQPLLHLVTLKIGFRQFVNYVTMFVNHVLFWKDGTYEIWDPLPWWWLYHVYWPGQFYVFLRTGKKWISVNVSTKRVWTY